MSKSLNTKQIPYNETSLHLDDTSDALDKEEFTRLDAKVRAGVAAFTEAAKAIAEIKARGLWKAGGYRSWKEYCHAALGRSPSYADRMARANPVLESLAMPIGTETCPLPTSESQIRPLLALKNPGEQAVAWSKAAVQSDGVPTAKIVAKVVEEMRSGLQPKADAPKRKAELLVQAQRTAVCGMEIFSEEDLGQYIVLLQEFREAWIASAPTSERIAA